MKSKNGAHLQQNNEENYKNINRPTESVSFSGSAVSEENKEAAKKKNKTAKILGITAAVAAAAAGCAALIYAFSKGETYDKIANNERFTKLVDFSYKHEAKVKALISLGLAGLLKPICVLAMPGAETEDKQFTATKNAISAFTGYFLSSVITDPISAGVNKFLDNPEKYLKPNSKLLEKLAGETNKPFTITPFKELKNQKFKTDIADGFKTVYKNAPGLAVAPLKAAITIALMPFVLKFLFGDRKKKEKTNEIPLYMEPLYNPILNNVSKNNSPFSIFAKGGETK